LDVSIGDRLNDGARVGELVIALSHSLMGVASARISGMGCGNTLIPGAL
jgi:hypothetical protein